jgi:molybdenum cofactor cytidylyltransferase
MKFGPVALSEAEGAVLAHSLVLGRVRLKKGHVLGPGDLEQIRQGGIDTVIVGAAGGG